MATPGCDMVEDAGDHSDHRPARTRAPRLIRLSARPDSRGERLANLTSESNGPPKHGNMDDVKNCTSHAYVHRISRSWPFSPSAQLHRERTVDAPMDSFSSAPTISTAPTEMTGVNRYTLTNCNGMVVRIFNYGGIIQSISFPDRHGRSDEVTLGFRRWPTTNPTAQRRTTGTRPVRASTSGR